MIRLFASDGRTMLDALDDAEAFRRQQARECPCTDEVEPGACENCDLHLLAADEYADLAGVIAEALEHYEPDGVLDQMPPNRHYMTGPSNPNFGRGIEEVPIRGGLL